MFDDDPEGTSFEVYDIKFLLGFALIAWALSLSMLLPELLA